MERHSVLLMECADEISDLGSQNFLHRYGLRPHHVHFDIPGTERGCHFESDEAGHLKQLLFLGEQVVGCLGWASAAWKIGPRDAHIGWSLEQRRARLALLVNNVRFLILPWVRLPHLASCVLALSVRGLSVHWQRRYGHAVYLAETFVDSASFAGTCYRAANWQCVGQTQGHAKRGHLYLRHGVVRSIYLYPLTRHWRQTLTAELS